MDKRTALVTGASSGIGYELTKLLAADGYSLLLVARGEDRLAAVADEMSALHGVSAHVYPADLSLPGAADVLVEAVRRDGHAVDVLVNNAGFTSFGQFHEIDPTRYVDMLELNVVALTLLTRLLLPDMISRRSGRVMNVASTAAFQPGPLMSAYFASKAYVLSFSAGLAHELRGTGVTVTCLCPGPTTSGFQERGVVGHSKIMQGRLLDAPRGAREGYRAMQRGRRQLVVGRWNSVLAFLPRVVPRAMAAAIVGYLQRPSHD